MHSKYINYAFNTIQDWGSTLQWSDCDEETRQTWCTTRSSNKSVFLQKTENSSIYLHVFLSFLSYIVQFSPFIFFLFFLLFTALPSLPAVAQGAVTEVSLVIIGLIQQSVIAHSLYAAHYTPAQQVYYALGWRFDSTRTQAAGLCVCVCEVETKVQSQWCKNDSQYGISQCRWERKKDILQHNRGFPSIQPGARWILSIFSESEIFSDFNVCFLLAAVCV